MEAVINVLLHYPSASKHGRSDRADNNVPASPHVPKRESEGGKAPREL